MTKQQEVQSVCERVSLCAEISPVLRDKVGWEQMSKELSLDGKTTDWWKVTESFVQSSQDRRGVLYNCHCVRGFYINCTVHPGTRAGMFVMKNDDTARLRQHYTPCVTTKTWGWNRWQPPAIELGARGITLKKNFKKKLQALKSAPLFSVSSSLTPSLKRTA